MFNKNKSNFIVLPWKGFRVRDFFHVEGLKSLRGISQLISELLGANWPGCAAGAPSQLGQEDFSVETNSDGRLGISTYVDKVTPFQKWCY